MKVCPHCKSADTYSNVRPRKHVCNRCGKESSQLDAVIVGAGIHGSYVTASEREQRIAKIRDVHANHPDYTRKDLVMVCFETTYMVSLYWQRHCSAKTAIIKTV